MLSANSIMLTMSPVRSISKEPCPKGVTLIRSMIPRLLVPDQLASVKIVTEDTGATCRMASNGGVLPRSPLEASYTLRIESVSD